MATEPERVAGHQFVGIGSDQRCACGRWWSEIIDCTEADIGKYSLAHSGNLDANELAQIRRKRASELAIYGDATTASAAAV